MRARLERLGALRKEAQAAGKARFAKLTLTRAGCVSLSERARAWAAHVSPLELAGLTHFPEPPKTLRQREAGARTAVSSPPNPPPSRSQRTQTHALKVRGNRRPELGFCRFPGLPRRSMEELVPGSARSG